MGVMLLGMEMVSTDGIFYLLFMRKCLDIFMNIYYPLIIYFLTKNKFNIYTYILNDKIINMYILY
jgi:hypothetical protein